MTENEEKPGLIYAKLAKILAGVKAVTKDQNNVEQHYKYRGIDDVFNELHAEFGKEGVFVTTELIDKNMDTYTTAKSGTLMHYWKAIYQFNFWAEDGSCVHAIMAGEAADSGDKGLNKCASAAYKVVLLQMFLIPTNEDKDADATTPEEQAPGKNPTGKDKPTGIPIKPSQELISKRKRMFAMAKEAGVPENELDEFKKQAFELSRLNYIEHSEDYTPKHWDAIYLLLNKKHLMTLALDKGIARDDLLDFCKAWFTEKKMPVKDTYNQFTQQHWDMLFNTLQGMESVLANVGAEDTPPESEQAGEGKA